MTRYGFIGTGSMGSMLVRQLIGSGLVCPEEIVASSRTGASARALAAETGIAAAPDNRAVVEQAGILFLCVRPLEVRGVLADIRGSLRPGTLLVSIAACVSLDRLHTWAGPAARCARVIPSITAEQQAGIALVAWGEGVEPEDRVRLLRLLNGIGTAVGTEERDFELATNLTSCGPALIAAIVREFSAGAVRAGAIPPEHAAFLARETLIGTARILAEGQMDFDEVIRRVATPGGSTEEGVKVLEDRLPAIMDEVHTALLAKRRLVEERVAGDDC